MLSRLKNKRGGTILLIVILLVVIFPLIVCSLIDLTNIYNISKRTKFSLNAAVKSASSRIDWTRVPYGEFWIDINEATNAFLDIMNENMNTELIGVNNYYVGDTQTGKKVRCFVTVYNDRHEGTYTNFPDAGSIPVAVTDKNLQVQVDRPTVFAVATVEYKLSPILGGRTIEITQFASSQLNIKAD